MSKINVCVEIDASAEAVFDVVANIENSHQHIEGIEKIEMLTDGDVGVGTKWRETRVMMKRESTEEMEITSFERPSHYSVYCDSAGYDMEWTMRVEALNEGSKLSLNMSSKPRTIIGKIMTPVEWLMVAVWAKKCVVKDLDDIKAFIEAQ